jgi:hypothetical protein
MLHLVFAAAIGEKGQALACQEPSVVRGPGKRRASARARPDPFVYANGLLLSHVLNASLAIRRKVRRVAQEP